jgi:hypothetical protein
MKLWGELGEEARYLVESPRWRRRWR